MNPEKANKLFSNFCYIIKYWSDLQINILIKVVNTFNSMSRNNKWYKQTVSYTQHCKLNFEHR